MTFKTFLISCACIIGFVVGCFALLLSWILFHSKGGSGQCCPTLISCYPCENRLAFFDYLWLLSGLVLVVSTPAILFLRYWLRR
jgi:H+/Cl- antiporter ClcA